MNRTLPAAVRRNPTANLGALNYQNEQVIARLAEEGAMSLEEARQLFNDTLRFLALIDNGFKLSPSARIDLGWHNFILHTRDYAIFCDRHFGAFIHHEPGSGLTYAGPMLDVEGTAELARAVYGELSPNWDSDNRGATCGSGGC